MPLNVLINSGRLDAYGRAPGRASVEVFPLEVVSLLDVLARIEARRQIRLRALRRKEVG